VTSLDKNDPSYIKWFGPEFMKLDLETRTRALTEAFMKRPAPAIEPNLGHAMYVALADWILLNEVRKSKTMLIIKQHEEPPA